jgi:hypothetical protein
LEEITSVPRSATTTKVSPTPLPRCATKVAIEHKTHDHKTNEPLALPPPMPPPESELCKQMSANAERTKQLWKGVKAANKKKLSMAHNTKDTEGALVNWKEHEGKQIPPIFTTVPTEYVESPEKVTKLTDMLGSLLGTHGETTVFYDAAKAPTGEVLLRVTALSEDGARKLTRGHWSPVPPKEGKEGDPRGFFTHKGQTIGTVQKPKYTLKQDNSIELRWDSSLKTTSDQPYPTKSTIYAALEKAEKQMYYEGIGLDASEWVDLTTGAVVEEEEGNTVSKTDFAAGWRLAQPRTIHALIPAYVNYHDDKDCPPRLSHSGRDQTSQKARADPYGLRMRFPKGFYKENQEIVRQVEESLGITIRTDNHPYPQYAIRDVMESLEAGQPMKEGQLCNSRALIKVNSAITSTCAGTTDPAALSAWLFRKCGTHYVGAGFREELTTKGDAPTAATYAYGVLVDITDPLQLMRITNHSVSGSDAVTMRRWGRMDKGRLRVLQNELYVADGKVSVVPQKKKDTVRATSACDLITQLTEEAKQVATRAGLEQSGYTAATQQQANNIITLQKRLDLAAGKAKLRELQAQVDALDKEAQQEKEREPKGAAPAAEAPAAEAPQARSPTKQRRSEIEITVSPQRGDPISLTIDTEDVPPGTGQRATLIDLARHLHELECFGEDFGIDPAGIEGYEQQDTRVKVYVEAEYQAQHEGKARWTHTVGKDAAAKTEKIDQLHGGHITFSPRIAAKPTSKHPEWLQAQVGEAPSPSPAKRVTQATNLRMRPSLPESLLLSLPLPMPLPLSQSPSIPTSTLMHWLIECNRRRHPGQDTKGRTDSEPSSSKKTKTKTWSKTTRKPSSPSCARNSTRRHHRKPKNCGRSCVNYARADKSRLKCESNCTSSASTKACYRPRRQTKLRPSRQTLDRTSTTKTKTENHRPRQRHKEHQDQNTRERIKRDNERYNERHKEQYNKNTVEPESISNIINTSKCNVTTSITKHRELNNKTNRRRIITGWATRISIRVAGTKPQLTNIRPKPINCSL